jgi:hypothetical protein
MAQATGLSFKTYFLISELHEIGKVPEVTLPGTNNYSSSTCIKPMFLWVLFYFGRFGFEVFGFSSLLEILLYNKPL